MNRREALRLLIGSPIVGPAAVKAAAEPDWRDLARTAPIDVAIITSPSYRWLEKLVEEFNRRQSHEA